MQPVILQDLARVRLFQELQKCKDSRDQKVLMNLKKYVFVELLEYVADKGLVTLQPTTNMSKGLQDGIGIILELTKAIMALSRSKADDKCEL